NYTMPSATSRLAGITTGPDGGIWVLEDSVNQVARIVPDQGLFTPTATPTPVGTPVTCPVQFNDVSVGSTFYNNIRCLACQNIVGGYSDGTFRPNTEVTRGQMAKF